MCVALGGLPCGYASSCLRRATGSRRARGLVAGGAAGGPAGTPAAACAWPGAQRVGAMDITRGGGSMACRSTARAALDTWPSSARQAGVQQSSQQGVPGPSRQPPDGQRRRSSTQGHAPGVAADLKRLAQHLAGGGGHVAQLPLATATQGAVRRRHQDAAQAMAGSGWSCGGQAANSIVPAAAQCHPQPLQRRSGERTVYSPTSGLGAGAAPSAALSPSTCGGRQGEHVSRLSRATRAVAACRRHRRRRRVAAGGSGERAGAAWGLGAVCSSL